MSVDLEVNRLGRTRPIIQDYNDVTVSARELRLL